jgi:uncharacterized BrkB/YihY/UPF0761 family membrane protein
MADIKGLEKSLNEVFGEKAPKLPEGGKKFLVEYSPYLVIIGAIFSALGAWGLWNSARTVNGLVNWANELSKAYGGETVATSHFTVWVWLGIAFMLINAVLYFMAYSPLKARLKKGWDYIFYAALLSVAYSVVSLFIDGRGFGTFLGSLIGSAIGLWLLFQIRSAYLGTKTPKVK